MAVLAVTGCAGRGGPSSAPDGGPIVVLVSIDGFRWDYIDRHPTPRLHQLAARGVRARWMAPSFPTLTFPNHYTIVTGLRPARHGIVGNHFIDPADNVRFRYSDINSSGQSRWWGGEPIWHTAARQGRRTATFFWPGSDAPVQGAYPERWKPFDFNVPNQARVDTVLSWLGLPAGDRPSLVTLYFDSVDHIGHEDGPESPALAAAVAEADSMIGRLVDGIERLGLTSRVNIIVVSDHGMAPTSNQRVVAIDDYLDRNTDNAVSLGQFISIIPGDRDTARLLRAISAAPHLTAYRADQMPARFQYRGNPRIAPVVVVMETGWTLSTRSAIAAGRATDRGAHGYDPADSLMRATFIAAGPALRPGVVAPPFGNIHVYELMCAILGLRPAPNDGSLDSLRGLLR